MPKPQEHWDEHGLEVDRLMSEEDRGDEGMGGELQLQQDQLQLL
jgi:hypothetical protein